MPKNIAPAPYIPWDTSVPNSSSPDTIVIRADIGPDNPTRTLALVSDLHADSADFDAALWNHCMEEIKKREAGVLVNGDIFDAMNSRNDPRRAAYALLDGEQKQEYFDMVIKRVHKTIKPVQDQMLVLGVGNHDATKHIETDLVGRLAKRINLERKHSKAVTEARKKRKLPTKKNRKYDLETLKGGYITSVKVELSYQKTSQFSFKILMYHGQGGGGRVSKGMQWLRELATQYPGYDVYWAGHWHQAIVHPFAQKTQKPPSDTWHKSLGWWIQTPSFKDESHDPDSWAKRGLIDLKPRGMVFLNFNYVDRSDFSRRRNVLIQPELLIMP